MDLAGTAQQAGLPNNLLRVVDYMCRHTARSAVMDHQLLPPHGTSPNLPPDISPADAVRAWIDLMKSSEKLVMAGLIHQVGSENAKAAYRDWYAEQAKRHANYLLRIAHRLRQAGAI